MFNPIVPFTALVALSLAAPGISAPAPAAPSAPTRAAVVKNINANFKAIDLNGDGVLNAAELQAAEAKGLQQRLAALRGKLEGEFTKLDTNKDGQLSKAEFMAAAPQTAGTPNGAALLTQLDKNKDGKITPDEYEAPVLARFDALDTNHDGTLSATERQAAAAQAQRKR